MTLKPKTKRTKRETPLWTLADGLTYSSLSTWLRCPELFRLQYIEGWSTPVFQESLEWGSYFHWLLEKIDHGSQDQIEEQVAALSQQYQKQFFPKKQRAEYSETDQDQIERMLGGVETVFPLYYPYWKDQKRKWIDREHIWQSTYRIDRPNNLQNVDKETELHLTGMIDGIHSEGRTKQPWLFETKCKGRIDELDIQSALCSDMQTMLYSLAIRLTTGKDPVGVLFNVIRRPLLDPQRKKQVKDYMAQVRDDVKARPAHYFKRWRIEFEPNDLSNFEQRQLRPLLRNFLTWYEGFFAHSKVEHPEINDPWSNPYHHKGATESLYVKNSKSYLYRAITEGNYSGLYQREATHPELQGV